jgi:predicted dehydrogenase
VNSLADVERLRAAINKSGKKFAVGFKKMFFPANVRMKQIIQSPEFGRIRSIALRYPQYIPTVEELKYGGTDRARWARRASFLDHLCHPVSLLQYLGGRTDSFYYLRAENGAGFALFTLRSGAAAAIHFSTSQSRSSPLERTEVTGDGANVVVDNNMRLTYYRPVRSETFRQYGRGSDFTGDLVEAPLVWEPEFSLGNLYNKGIFLLGYYNEIKHFCDAVLENREVDLGNIDDAEEGIRIYEAFAQGPKRLLTI